MIVRCKKGSIFSTQEIENADAVIIYDKYRNPVAALKAVDGQILHSSAKDPDFVQFIRSLGLDPKTQYCNTKGGS